MGDSEVVVATGVLSNAVLPSVVEFVITPVTVAVDTSKSVVDETGLVVDGFTGTRVPPTTVVLIETFTLVVTSTLRVEVAFTIGELVVKPVRGFSDVAGVERLLVVDADVGMEEDATITADVSFFIVVVEIVVVILGLAVEDST